MSTSSITFAPGSTSKPAVQRHIDLPKNAHIAVLGAGVFGGWTALMLLEKGFRVTLIDPWGPGNSRASSGGESRLIRMIYGGDGFYTRLATRAYVLWEAYQERFGVQCLYPTGNLWMSAEADPMIDLACSYLDEVQLPYEKLNPAEVTERFPGINIEGLKHIVHEQKTGYLLARESCVAVRDFFVQQGGQYLQKLPDMNALLDNGKTLRLEDGSQIEADAFICACGPWLPQLFPEWLAPHLSVTRQEIYYFGIPAKQAASLEKLPTWIIQEEEQSFYGVPSTKHRGFKVATDQRGGSFDPTQGDRTPTTALVEAARSFLAKRFYGMENAPLLEARVCQYSNTANGHFIFDRHPNQKNIFVLGGGSGHGFKHGPAVGELIAQAFSGDQAMPHEWLLPNT